MSSSSSNMSIPYGTKHQRNLVCPECLQAFPPQLRDYYKRLVENGGDEDDFFHQVATTQGILSREYWNGYEGIRNTDIKECCKNAFRKDPDLATLHPRFGSQSYEDPSIKTLGFIGCSGCGSRKTSQLTELFNRKVGKEGMDPELFFNQYKVKECCRKFIIAPHLIPMGSKFYNPNLISGTPVESVGHSTGKYYYEEAKTQQPTVVDMVNKSSTSAKSRLATVSLVSSILEGSSTEGVSSTSFFRNVSDPNTRPEVKSSRSVIFAKDFDFESESKAERVNPDVLKSEEERAKELFLQQFPGGAISSEAFAPIQVQTPIPSFSSSVPQKEFPWMTSSSSSSSSSFQTPAPEPWMTSSSSTSSSIPQKEFPWMTTSSSSSSFQTPATEPWMTSSSTQSSESWGSWTPSSTSSTSSTNFWESITSTIPSTTSISTSQPSSSSSTELALPVIQLESTKETKVELPDSYKIPNRNDPVLRQKIIDVLRSRKKREPTNVEIESTLNEYLARAQKKQKDYLLSRMQKEKKTRQLAFPGVYKVEPTDYQRDEQGNIIYHEANPDYVPDSKSIPSYKIPKLVGYYQAR